MKKIIFVAISLVFLMSACGNEDVAYFENAAHSEVENAGVNQGQYYPEGDIHNNNR